MPSVVMEEDAAGPKQNPRRSRPVEEGGALGCGAQAVHEQGGAGGGGGEAGGAGGALGGAAGEGEERREGEGAGAWHQGTTRSMRAGTCLCQGVPTKGSRSSAAVSSFGATPVTVSPASLGYATPRPLGSAA